jgi:uncharacterized membrane protein
MYVFFPPYSGVFENKIIRIHNMGEGCSENVWTKLFELAASTQVVTSNTVVFIFIVAPCILKIH